MFLIIHSSLVLYTHSFVPRAFVTQHKQLREYNTVYICLTFHEASSICCLCDVTLSAYPHRAGLKNMPGHGGIRTYDLWNTSPMLFLTELHGQVGSSVRYFGTESSSFDISVI